MIYKITVQHLIEFTSSVFMGKSWTPIRASTHWTLKEIDFKEYCNFDWFQNILIVPRVLYFFTNAHLFIILLIILA